MKTSSEGTTSHLPDQELTDEPATQPKKIFSEPLPSIEEQLFHPAHIARTALPLARIHAARARLNRGS